MLTAGEIAGMQAVCGQTLDESCAIGRRGEVSDGGGRKTITYPTVATVDCARAPYDSQGSEAPLGDRATAQARWIVTLPAGTDVRSSDRLTIGGTVYEVLSIRSDRTYELTTRVECERLG
jgi:hypothetical protein